MSLAIEDMKYVCVHNVIFCHCKILHYQSVLSDRSAERETTSPQDAFVQTIASHEYWIYHSSASVLEPEAQAPDAKQCRKAKVLHQQPCFRARGNHIVARLCNKESLFPIKVQQPRPASRYLVARYQRLSKK